MIFSMSSEFVAILRTKTAIQTREKRHSFLKLDYCLRFQLRFARFLSYSFIFCDSLQETQTDFGQRNFKSAAFWTCRAFVARLMIANSLVFCFFRFVLFVFGAEMLIIVLLASTFVLLFCTLCVLCLQSQQVQIAAFKASNKRSNTHNKTHWFFVCCATQ